MDVTASTKRTRPFTSCRRLYQRSDNPLQSLLFAVSVILWCTCCLAATTAASSPENTSSPAVCSVWLAPSTLPGAGLGIFAGQDFTAGDQVTPGDVIIPVVDMAWHAGSEATYESKFLWDDYMWAANSFTGMDVEGHEVYGASFGIGALPNCHFALIGVGESDSAIDTAGLHRSRDVGAGGFSPYYNRQGLATRNLQAGEELFVDYGYDYFESRDSTLGFVPFLEHYDSAKLLFQSLHRLRNSIQQRQFHRSLDKTLDAVFEDLHSLIHARLPKIWPSRLWLALQNQPRLDEPVRNDTKIIRSQEWLETEGLCLDHLYVDTSTIPQAGRGAFARHEIHAGQVVSPVPLIHLPDKSILTTYLGYNNPKTGYYERNVSAPIHAQLMLNYCFGHDESTLLLCPYGVVSSVINHSSGQANIRLEWSRQLSSHLEWLHQPLDTWAYEYQTGLVLEYIALTDIQPGDEILMDYGPAWEAAWQHHVTHWMPPSNADKYQSAQQLNDDWDGILSTIYEIPSFDVDSVEMYCRPEYIKLAGINESDHELQNCRVVYRNHAGRYTAELYWNDPSEQTDTCHEDVWAVLLDVPRDAFWFQDVMYTRDHAQPWAFRHEIGLPDHLFPNIWKNQKARATDA